MVYLCIFLIEKFIKTIDIHPYECYNIITAREQTATSRTSGGSKSKPAYQESGQTAPETARANQRKPDPLRKTTVTTTAADVKPWEAFLAEYEVKFGACAWLYYFDEAGAVRDIFRDTYYSLDGDSQEDIRQRAAAFEYHKEIKTRNTVNHHWMDSYTVFSASGLAKLKKVLAIIEAYRYDESNGMVDYFNTNFYIDICTKPGKDVA